MEFIHQPFGNRRLGDFLKANLRDPQWSEFRAAIAFVKRSGTQHIRTELAEFDGRATVRLTVGVDFFGTSIEGLQDLFSALQRGRLYVLHNPGPSTFHPKLYAFANAQAARVIIGSGNLTEGGLFTNYESSVAIDLDRANVSDAAFLATVEQILDGWCAEVPGTCYFLTTEILNGLVSAGLVRSEAQLAAIARQAATTIPAHGGLHLRLEDHRDALFGARRVPSAPRVSQPFQAEGAAENIAETEAEILVQAPPAVPAAAAPPPSSFVMTLQNTDVGVGQLTPGRARRSPEVFIPLAALDAHPDFWTYPDQFTPDESWNAEHPEWRRNGIGKMDRMNVPMRIGTIQHVSMFFNPNKRDLRLRNEVLRSSGHIGDIILIQRSDPATGYEYDVHVIPQGSPEFDGFRTLCTQQVRNSLKMFGYF